MSHDSYFLLADTAAKLDQGQGITSLTLLVGWLVYLVYMRYTTQQHVVFAFIGLHFHPLNIIVNKLLLNVQNYNSYYYLLYILS